MATTRVYILAKQLGVKSSAIVKKCQDEGLDIKNHMSVISAGLTATIREWFSEGESTTAVETSQKVDLKKVRITKKTKRKQPKKKVKKAKRATDKPTEDTGIELPSETEVVEEPEKKEPEPILPAGPILEKPEPARLSGPQVIRVEAPEPTISRTKPRPRYDEPITEPLMYSMPEEEYQPKTKKGQPKRYKERTHGRRREEKDEEAAKKVKQTSKWRQRDIEERKARLSAAGGEGLRLRPLSENQFQLRTYPQLWLLNQETLSKN